MIQGIFKIATYIDDILNLGASVKEKNDNLHVVLKKLKDAGFQLKSDKCKLKKILTLVKKLIKKESTQLKTKLI